MVRFARFSAAITNGLQYNINNPIRNISMSLTSPDVSSRVTMEIQRSRRYERPISVISIRSEPELQPKTLETVATHLRLNDFVVIRRSGSAVIICPETNAHGASNLIERLVRITKFQLQMAAATFPANGTRFSDLAEAAEKLNRNKINSHPET